ncbi:MAG: 4-hydroxythreonine-4-phosphate dehydrogenase PdxA [Thermoanaerobaculia bacterium]|nr:4-hydroxythreonine-4-phosphate dehydrogenase PdxA [Thermoanaerobaculia bacterium]
MTRLPTFVFTQGDPAGIGPEILLRESTRRQTEGDRRFHTVLVVEKAAIEALNWAMPVDPGLLELVDPLGEERTVTPGHPTPADARGALAALDEGVRRVQALREQDRPAALVTAPLAKAPIAELQSGFRGHTDYLARGAGLERYGRDYLMAFLSPNLRVALLSAHCSLREAIDRVSVESVTDAVRCLARHGGPGRDPGPIAVCGLNPHAGEGGLLGTEDEELVRPAIVRLQDEGIDVHGPLPADTVFERARRGDFRWVLALYHDQGLVAVKTAAFGQATNWTVGLPYLRTSVDHGTAYDIAGRGIADTGSLRAVIEQTLELL